MKTLTDQLSKYAAYHRDRRNIATHFVGIPAIVLGVIAILSRPSVLVGSVPVSPALVAVVGSVVFYAALDKRFGVAMAALMAAGLWAGHWIAGLSTTVWLATSIGLFVVGWAFQFVGHAMEGRKPAFVDDLRDAIERRVGPTHGGDARAASLR